MRGTVGSQDPGSRPGPSSLRPGVQTPRPSSLRPRGPDPQALLTQTQGVQLTFLSLCKNSSVSPSLWIWLLLLLLVLCLLTLSQSLSTFLLTWFLFSIFGSEFLPPHLYFY